MPSRDRFVPDSAMSVTWNVAYAEDCGSNVWTEMLSPAFVRAIASRKSVYEWMSVPLTCVIMVYADMLADWAGELPVVNPTIPTPSWTGVTDAIITDEKRTANRTASRMFVAGPAA